MNWVEYLSQIFRFAGVEITEDIRLYHPGAEMIYGVLNLVKKTDPKIVKNFALLRVFLFQAPDSDTSTRKAFEDYYNAKGYQLYPRWEYCTRKLLDVIDTATLSYAITYDYQLYHYDINKISEAFTLVQNIRVDYNIALNVTKYLKQEREFVPWKAAFTSLDYMYEMFVRTAHFDKYKRYLLDLLQDFYKEIGFDERENDEQLVVYNRFEVNNRVCRLGVRDCVINSIRQFETWKNSPYPDHRNSISENLREIVYCTAISVGGQAEWDFAWERYLNANVENEKETLLMALGCSKEIWILSRYLEWAVTERSGIRKHDSARVFAAVANNAIGQQLAYRFLKTNWNRLRT
jgi:hypothetical protein